MRKGSNLGPFFAALCGLLGALAAGCAPKLGDSCNQSTDCSVQGDRECDTSVPGGYCTVEDCIEGACDGEGYCVRFEPDQIRLSSSWCMAKCGRGCRVGFRCVSIEDLNAERCGGEAGLELWRRVDPMTPEEREMLSAADQQAWTDLQACLVTQPRAAEVLDDVSSSVRFCGQEPFEGQSESGQASGG